MNKRDRKRLQLGLYRIEWRDDGGTSVAAIGQTANGDRWLAPCNWLAPVDEDDLALAWRSVTAVTLIEAAWPA